MFGRSRSVENFSDDRVREVVAGNAHRAESASAAYLVPSQAFALVTTNHDLISAQAAARLATDAIRLDGTWRRRKALTEQSLRELVVLFPAQRLGELLRELGGLGNTADGEAAVTAAIETAADTADRHLPTHRRPDKESVRVFFFGEGDGADNAPTMYLDHLVAEAITAYLEALRAALPGALPAQRTGPVAHSGSAEAVVEPASGPARR